ncbi:hypothetical protein R3P38DRAFT_3209650 [Favolaschia claudopus]|uniref:Uncharacterized protein n=1 Tax=Favolaschia claudopus TaxID=2862362 RepID=A0AAW0AHY4_9AGAR
MSGQRLFTPLLLRNCPPLASTFLVVPRTWRPLRPTSSHSVKLLLVYRRPRLPVFTAYGATPLPSSAATVYASPALTLFSAGIPHSTAQYRPRSHAADAIRGSVSGSPPPPAHHRGDRGGAAHPGNISQVAERSSTLPINCVRLDIPRRGHFYLVS